MKNNDLLTVDVLEFADSMKWYIDGIQDTTNLDGFHPSRNSNITDYKNPGNDLSTNVSEVVPAGRILSFLMESIEWLLDRHEREQQNVVNVLIEHEKDISEFALDINYCDGTLRLVHELLDKHFSKLKLASSNIENLHEESAGISYCINNRTMLLKRLQSFIYDVVITPSMIRRICNDPIDDASFVELVEHFQHKCNKLNTVWSTVNYPCLESSRVQMKRLHLACTRRIYDYFSSEINKLVAPKVNIHLIQSGKFMKLKPLYDFLPVQYATELKRQYVHTMKKINVHIFANYLTNLDKYKQRNTWRDVNVIMKNWSASDNLFDLNNHSILQHQAHALITINLTKESITSSDAIRSWQKVLVDSATSECWFLGQFFNAPELLADVFHDATTLLNTKIINSCKSSYNIISIAFIYQSTLLNIGELRRRQCNFLVPSLEQMQHVLYRRIVYVINEFAKCTNTIIQVATSNVLQSWNPIDFCVNSGLMATALTDLSTLTKHLPVKGNEKTLDSLAMDYINCLYAELQAASKKLSLIDEAKFMLSNAGALQHFDSRLLSLDYFNIVLDDLRNTKFHKMMNANVELRDKLATTRTIEKASAASKWKPLLEQFADNVRDDINEVKQTISIFPKKIAQEILKKLVHDSIELYKPLIEFMELNEIKCHVASVEQLHESLMQTIVDT